MSAKLHTLSKVITGIDLIPWTYALYLRGTPPWDANAPAAVLDPDEAESPRQGPAFAEAHGLYYVLDVPSIQDIVVNAKQQMPGIRLEGLLQAFNYYCAHDAFIDLGQTKGTHDGCS